MKMVMNWPKKNITSLCDITSSKRIYAAEYQSEGIPFYRGREISEKYKGNLDVSTELFIKESKYLEIKEKFGVPKPGDLLLTSVGTLGNPYIVKEGEIFYFKDGNLTWFRNIKELSSKFLFYWLISPQGKAELNKCKIGSSQSAFTIVLLKKMQIDLPPLSTQRKIAVVLSAYDDLIENNTRRIQILEEMAQTIYRQWFVEFKYPGHESVPLVDSETELGEIPQGWEVKELQYANISIVDGDRGKNYPKKSEFSESGYCLFLNASNIQNDKFDYSKMNFITSERDSLLRKGKLQSNDTVLTTRGTVGRLAFHSENAPYKNVRINSGMVIIRSNSPTQNSLYWFHLLKSHWLKEQYQLFSSGAAQPQLPIKDMKRINVLVPLEKYILSFCEIISPVFAQMEMLQQKNTNLRATRELLLPRLVSGEVGVDEIVVEGVEE